jgi:glucose/arabinose dehydrogenase
MKVYRYVLVVKLFGIAVQTAQFSAGFTEETLAEGINAATAMAVFKDRRIFIAEQTGSLRVWKEERLLEQPALSVDVTDYWERGLIGLALHPDCPKTPYLYALYVSEQPYVHHVLSRFTIEGDVAKAGSEKVLLKGDNQSKSGGNVSAGHRGGPLRFGADGKLYVALG